MDQLQNELPMVKISSQKIMIGGHRVADSKPVQSKRSGANDLFAGNSQPTNLSSVADNAHQQSVNFD